MRVAYVSVSTVDGDVTKQVEALKKYDIEKWYIEKGFSTNTNRPKLQELLEYVKDGDTIYIYNFSRLTRNVKELLDIVEYLRNKNVNLVSIKDHFDSSTPSGKDLLTKLERGF